MADAEPPDEDERSPSGEPADASDDPAEAGSSGLAPAAPEAPSVPAPAEGGGEGPPPSPLEQRARLAEDRLVEVLAAYRTLKTENEDYRERQSRNLERRFDQRRERLLLKFIDVLDNLDRALEAAQTSYAGQPLLEGMILVRTHLLQTLQDEGLDRIPVLGLPFDPAVSESVSTQAVKDAEQHHIVVKELLRGYRLNGRIARPSRVVIGTFEGALSAEAASPEPSPQIIPAPVPPAAAEPAAAHEPAPAEAAPAPATDAGDVATPAIASPLPPKAHAPSRRKGRA